MADESKIKQRIELEGEKEYNAALAEARRNLKTLRSELKAETAELGNNATAQQKNEVRTKNLQKQIKEQEKVVKTYQDALKEVKEKYGDNDEAVAKWEQKLNEARATLANMKNSLDGVGEGMKNIQSGAEMGVVATKSLSDALKGVGDAADSISSALESAFSSVFNIIRDTITDLWDEVMQVSAKANAWTDLADYFGTTPANVQKWSNAIKGAGGSFEDFTTILNKFKTGGVNKKITEYFGVSDVNYKDDMEYTVAVLRKMVEMREKMEKAGTWDEALADIFGGKKSQAAGWFVSNWQTIEKNLGRYDADNGGVGMSTEELETMNQLYIDVQNIKTTWEAFKDSFLAGAFGKLSLDLVGNAQGILDGLIAFMGADNESERQKAIDQIQENMTSFFTRLGEAIEAAAKALDEVGTELAGSENGYVAMIGKALQSLSNVLDWIIQPDNLEQVRKFFDTLIAVWAGGKAIKAAGYISSFAASILTIKNGGRWLLGGASGFGTSGFTGAGAGAATATATALTASEVTAAVTAAAGPFASAIAGLTMSVGLVTIAVPVVELLKDVIKGSWPDWLQDPNKEPGETLLPDASEELQDAVTEALETPTNPFKAPSWQDIINGLGNWGQAKDDVVEAFKTGADKLLEEMQETAQYGGAGHNFIPAYTERTPQGIVRGLAVTQEQMEAAEAFWDVFKQSRDMDEIGEAYDAFVEAFAGNEETFKRLDSMLDELYDYYNANGIDTSGIENLPADWWRNGGGLTSEDVSGFKSVPGLMKAAVREGVSGIKVSLDGYRVGELIAPYVSEMIAREMA